MPPGFGADVNNSQCFSTDPCFTVGETAQLAVYAAFIWLTANWLFNASLQYTNVASAIVLKSTSGLYG